MGRLSPHAEYAELQTTDPELDALVVCDPVVGNIVNALTEVNNRYNAPGAGQDVYALEGGVRIKLMDALTEVKLAVAKRIQMGASNK